MGEYILTLHNQVSTITYYSFENKKPHLLRLCLCRFLSRKSWWRSFSTRYLKRLKWYTLWPSFLNCFQLVGITFFFLLFSFSSFSALLCLFLLLSPLGLLLFSLPLSSLSLNFFAKTSPTTWNTQLVLSIRTRFSFFFLLKFLTTFGQQLKCLRKFKIFY